MIKYIFCAFLLLFNNQTFAQNDPFVIAKPILINMSIVSNLDNSNLTQATLKLNHGYLAFIKVPKDNNCKIIDKLQALLIHPDLIDNKPFIKACISIDGRTCLDKLIEQNNSKQININFKPNCSTVKLTVQDY